MLKTVSLLSAICQMYWLLNVILLAQFKKKKKVFLITSQREEENVYVVCILDREGNRVFASIRALY